MEGNAVREGKGEIHERIGRGERREVIRQREKKETKKRHNLHTKGGREGEGEAEYMIKH